MNKPLRREIDGIVLLDKPLHLSSNAALQQVRRLFNARKAGHTGSLDPLATGMLPICLGQATKFSQFLLQADKVYVTQAQLGVCTSTGDSEGDIIATAPVPTLDTVQVEQVLSQFLGQQLQTPSMFSALKYQGQPLYKLARKGQVVERKPRAIQVFALQLLHLTAESLWLQVHCSKGTYIRSLVEDIGAALGCGAHVASLRRERVGQFLTTSMLTLDALAALAQTGQTALDATLLPMQAALQGYPSCVVDEANCQQLMYGQTLRLAPTISPGLVCLQRENGQFIGVGKSLDNGQLQAVRLIAQNDSLAVEKKCYPTPFGKSCDIGNE